MSDDAALHDWVQMISEAFDVPGGIDTAALLELTRQVAHTVARPAAPLTLFFVGLAAGRAGGTAGEVRAAAARVELLVAEWMSAHRDDQA
jgi:hypothetical protein